MKFSEIYAQEHPVLSLEFFPPKSRDGLDATYSTIQNLTEVNPDFMTVTYGAGGGTRALTREIVSHIHRELNVTAVAHLTCVGHSVEEIDRITDELHDEGVRHILALRGDPPNNSREFVPHENGFTCARDLARHLSAGERFSLAVAGYPETHADAQSDDGDISYLKEKVDAGGEIVITQLFFDPQMYFSFVQRARAAGITAPIVPGIIPIRDVNQIERFTKMCGASIPDPLRQKLLPIKENVAAVRAFGTHYAVDMCRQLLEGGAPGLHLYTLNRSTQVKDIILELTRMGLLAARDALVSGVG